MSQSTDKGAPKSGLELGSGDESVVSPRPRQIRSAVTFKSPPSVHDQYQLFPANVFELLPLDHDCFVFRDLFAELDTSAAEQGYSPLGQHAYAPKQILSILIYAYCHGVYSSRQIEKRCREDLGFMYIAQSHCPNFRVLSDFRRDHRALFEACFRQTVRLALELKLARLGHVSLDGSKFKANSSKHKAMSYQRLCEQEQQLNEQIAALLKQAEQADAEEDEAYGDDDGDGGLPQELTFKQQRLEKIRAAKAALEQRERAKEGETPIKPDKQISFADHEARIMGKSGQFDYAYNAQISVDSTSQIIVGEHISQRADDFGELEQALEQIKAACGRQADQLSADSGYYSGENLALLEQYHIEGYVAARRSMKPPQEALENSKRPVHKSDFRYDQAHDAYVCPRGQRLKRVRADYTGRRHYQALEALCQSCDLHSRCCRSSQGQGRTVIADQYEGERQRMGERLGQLEGQAVYRQRKHIVEPVFGQIKNAGFRGFHLRGVARVAGEFALVCTAHNLKKLVKAAMAGQVCRQDGKWAAVAA